MQRYYLHFSPFTSRPLDWQSKVYPESNSKGTLSQEFRYWEQTQQNFGIAENEEWTWGKPSSYTWLSQRLSTKGKSGGQERSCYIAYSVWLFKWIRPFLLELINPWERYSSKKGKFILNNFTGADVKSETASTSQFGRYWSSPLVFLSSRRPLPELTHYGKLQNQLEGQAG